MRRVVEVRHRHTPLTRIPQAFPGWLPAWSLAPALCGQKEAPVDIGVQ